MGTETRSCQNCKSDFTIESSDFDFYKKIDVPAPTWCPKCRNVRRMAWREERMLYRGTCAMCGKSIITVHAPGGSFTIYCRECFKSDKWDPMDYGRDYDFSKPFFKQYRELMEAIPRPALTGSNLVNSEFSHGSIGLKNCYYIFWSYYSEDSQNCYGLLLSKFAFDSYAADNSDHVYECFHSNRLYRVRYGYFADECLDSSLLFNCLGCSDCFGCVNLRKQKYCIFNKRFTKEEYAKEIQKWDLGSYAKLQEAIQRFRELYLSVPHPFAHIISSQNVTGDIIRDAKDCQMCFLALDGVQNCKYLYGAGLGLKDSMDVSAGGDSGELLYEVFAVTGNVARVIFCAGGGNSTDTWYSDWVENSSNTFGCISLKNKKYCILNKQYAREGYEALVSKIRKHMDEMPYVDKKGRVYKFGEFFPTELSAYAYNEAFGFIWYPKTKEEVLQEGWEWREPSEHSYQITIKSENLSDHIREVTDSITNEIIGCAHGGTCNEQCSTAFRITQPELDFYREMNIPLPRLCFNCRYIARLKWRNGFDLYHRSCQCGSDIGSQKSDIGHPTSDIRYQNSAQHAHGDNPCTNEFETTFSPDQPEIIYCTDCYRAEFI